MELMSPSGLDYSCDRHQFTSPASSPASPPHCTVISARSRHACLQFSVRVLIHQLDEP